jgi:hypothetical protein
MVDHCGLRALVGGSPKRARSEADMASSRRDHHCIASHEECETIRLTHHPAIYDVEVAEFKAMRPRLRKMACAYARPYSSSVGSRE